MVGRKEMKWGLLMVERRETSLADTSDGWLAGPKGIGTAVKRALQ